MHYIGIDIGSATTKAVAIDEVGAMIAHNLIPTGANSRTAGESAFQGLLKATGIRRDEIGFIVSTGYGREVADFADARVTEITCHARGVHVINPATRSILDIGGQDSKAIRVGETGRVLDFVMNDKCAAGTGRFLEVMSRVLEVEIERMGPLSLQSTDMAPVSSMCTVFAESEVISLIAKDCKVEDILSGIHHAITDRVAGLLERVGREEVIAFTGGVAKNIGVRECLEKRLSCKFFIPPEPQITGALGAAQIARERGMGGK